MTYDPPVLTHDRLRKMTDSELENGGRSSQSPLAVYRISIYNKFVIRSFRDPETEKVFNQEFSKKFHAIGRTALRKLIQLNQAIALRDLSLPGNHLEALKGDRKGRHSIRINDQFRVCFRWTEPDAFDVEITDYH